MKTIPFAAGAIALTMLAPSSALAQGAPHNGPGVPAGQIEATQYTVQVTGSNAVGRFERTRQWLTAHRSHAISTTIKTRKVRFEGSTSPGHEFRFDGEANTMSKGKGMRTPPYQSTVQSSRVFQQSAEKGCYTLTGSQMFNGRSADVYALVPASSGPCRGDAEVGQAIVDKQSGTILQRTAGETDGSFTQVETLESLKTLPAGRANNRLLLMHAHKGAKPVKR